MKRKKLFTEKDYIELTNDNAGICLACGKITWEGVEPDAEGYTCEGCHNQMLMGVEQALLTGHIGIADTAPGVGVVEKKHEAE